MASSTGNHTPLHPVRIPDLSWEQFGDQVGDRQRSKVIREFIDWHLHRPGAKAPTRPPKPQRPQQQSSPP